MRYHGWVTQLPGGLGTAVCRRIGRAAAAVALALLLAPAAAAAAGPSCHCFRDRAFDPANPEKSDEYLLATASNTLLAAAYGMPKRAIVQARMSGTSGEDLWIAAFAAHRRGGDAGSLMQARSAAVSWREVFRQGTGPIEPLGPRFIAALATGADDTALARVAASETLSERLGTPWKQLDDLAAAGATLQQMVIASLIGAWSSRAAPEVYAEVVAGKTGWSRLLAALGKVPAQMEVEVPRALRPAGR